MQKVKVKIKSIQPVVVGSGLNMIEIIGYDATNRKGFKKRAFETKQDGTPTQIATVLKDAKPGDWFEFTLDDSSYHNPSTAAKVSGPAPDAASSGSSPRAGGFKKGEFRSVPELNRDVALNAALKFLEIAKPAKSKLTADNVTLLAEKFYEFLTKGSRPADNNPSNDAPKPEVDAPPAGKPEPSEDTPPPPDNEDDIPW